MALVTHGSPVLNSRASTSKDGAQKKLTQREYTTNIRKIIGNRVEKSEFDSNNHDADDTYPKETEVRSSSKISGMISTLFRRDDISQRDLLDTTNINRKKRQIDVILGGEYDEYDPDDDDFPYGSDDDDYTDYGNPYQDNYGRGYWVECAEDPTLECFYDGRFPPGYWSRCEDEDGPTEWCYYYADGASNSPRGYWQECADDPDNECYYYNDDARDALGFWDYCADNRDYECYFYYDLIWTFVRQVKKWGKQRKI